MIIPILSCALMLVTCKAASSIENPYENCMQDYFKYMSKQVDDGKRKDDAFANLLEAKRQCSTYEKCIGARMKILAEKATDDAKMAHDDHLQEAKKLCIGLPEESAPSRV